MKLKEQFTYPFGAADVFGLVADAAFRKKAVEATGSLDVDVDVKRSGDGAIVTITRSYPAKVPDIVKPFVGETIEVKQVETWSAPDADGSRTADVNLQVPGQPAGMKGHASLTDKGGEALFVVEGDVKVKVPFVGKKVEPYIATIIEKSLRHDVEAGIKELSRK